MSLFDLRLVDPRTPGEYSEYLDEWTNLNASSDRKAPGQLAFDIPEDAENRDLLDWLQVVAFVQDGVEATNCRYLVRKQTGNDMPAEGQSKIAHYEAYTVWDAFKDCEVVHSANEDQIVYTNRTVGKMIFDAIQACANRGYLDWWGYQGMTFNETVDSEGNAWDQVASVQFDDGVKVFELIDWFIQNGYVEISSDGGFINAYAPSKRGTDLTAAARPVTLVQGVDLTDAPWETSWDDVATQVTVIGGETPDPSDSSKTRPRLKVVVTGVGGTNPAADAAINVGYGNLYGGYGPHDKKHIYKGKDWKARVPTQVSLILGMGVQMFGAVELHETKSSETPDGCDAYLADRLTASAGTQWVVSRGDHGNHLLFETRTYEEAAKRQNVKLPYNRGMSFYTMRHKATGWVVGVGVSHFQAFQNSTSYKKRKKQADYVAKFFAKQKIPCIFMADINDPTKKTGMARHILEASGMLSLRTREPAMPGYNKSSHVQGTKLGAYWLEDIWTWAYEGVSGSAGVDTADSSDHAMWFRTSVTLAGTGSAPDKPYSTQAWGVRQRRIKVEGVQDATTLYQIGRKWLDLRLEPRTSRTYATAVAQPSDTPVVRPASFGQRPTTPLFTFQQTLIPPSKSLSIKAVVQAQRYLYTSQLDGSKTVVVRWLAGKQSGKITVPTAAADELHIASVLVDDKATDFVVLPFGGDGLQSTSSRQWVQLPWKSDQSWKESDAMKYKVAAPRASSVSRPSPIKGEAGPLLGYFWRSYGSEFNIGGVPNTKWTLQVVHDGVVQAPIDLTGLQAGYASGTRVDLAGLSITRVKGWPTLLIGVQTGTSGSYALDVWTYPILADELGPVWVDRDAAELIPMVDFGVADTIGIDLANEEPATAERIEVITASCDTATAGTYMISTGDWLDDRDARVDRLLARYGGSD